MGQLEEGLKAADRRTVIRDTVRLIDREVDNKSGLTGMALKGGYKVVKKLRNGAMIEQAVDHLLDDFARSLEPLYEEYLAQEDHEGFDRFLKRHDRRATDALLGITDARIGRVETKIIQTTYNKLRGQAEKHVSDALPGLGGLIDRHVDASAARGD